MKKLVLVVAWLWVAVPLGWGIYQSVQKSLPLFEVKPQENGIQLAN